jgi:chromosome segregation ATPase
MDTKEILAHLNSADKKELVKLPGIGTVLAERIISARPFDSLESIKSIRGVNQNLINTWLTSNEEPVKIAENLEEELKTPIEGSPSIADESANESGESSRDRFAGIGEVLKSRTQTAYESVKEGISSVGESVKERVPDMNELQEKIEQVSQSRGVLWTVMVASGITFLLSIIFTLIILSSINGSLKFATDSEYRAMQYEFSQISTRADALQNELDGLRERVNLLEGLGERMVVLEKSQVQITADMETTLNQMTELQKELADIKAQITEQDKRTIRFETFLKDLQSMLASLFGQQGDSQ